MIYSGWPYSFFDYAQKIGCTGQDSQSRKTVLIQSQTISKSLFWIYSEKIFLDETTIVQQWLTTDQFFCRRILLDSYLDRQKQIFYQNRTVPESAAEILCEVCTADNPYKIFISGSIFPLSFLNPVSPPVFDTPVSDSDNNYYISGFLPVNNIPAEIDLPSPLSRLYILIDIDKNYSPVYYISSISEYICQLPFVPNSIQSLYLGFSTAETLSPSVFLCTISVAGRYLLRQQNISRTIQTNQIYQNRYIYTIAEKNLRQKFIRWNLRCWVYMINQQSDKYKLLYCTSPQSTDTQV